MKIVYIDTYILSICIHEVGNKIADDGLSYSLCPIKTNETIKEVLTTYFINSFTTHEYFQLYHDSDLNLNEVYSYISRIFDNPELLYEQSVNLAKHLYNQSTHHKIKGGEFYTVPSMQLACLNRKTKILF